eukprot:1867942-Pleurochrysis_carterae.AAC.3
MLRVPPSPPGRVLQSASSPCDLSMHTNGPSSMLKSACARAQTLARVRSIIPRARMRNRARSSTRARKRMHTRSPPPLRCTLGVGVWRWRRPRWATRPRLRRRRSSSRRSAHRRVPREAALSRTCAFVPVDATTRTRRRKHAS